MKKILMVLAVFAAAAGFASIAARTAMADDDCSVPRADWQPRDAVARLAEENGWIVRKFKVEDGCYELKGRDRDGRKIEVEINPATIEIMDLEYENDVEDDRGAARKPATAGTQAPPQNKLFGNGPPPNATVR